MPITKLIMSAAYVNQELAAEFGKLPPAFLPLGLSRLYEAQAAALGGGPIILSLPESFKPFPSDLARLEQLGVELLMIPENISLGAAISYALGIIAAPADPLLLLHGDTLIEDVSEFLTGESRIAVHDKFDGYSWAAVDTADGLVRGLRDIDAGFDYQESTSVACGLFSFEASSSLLRAITRARGDFIQGLTLYAAELDVKPVKLERWHDFGHLQTYFRSRRNIITARSFNSLEIDACAVRKSSNDRDKMLAEANWFHTVPAPLLPYTARLLSVDETEAGVTYATEYAYAPTLAELFVFSALGRSSWHHVLRSCVDFLNVCVAFRAPETDATSLDGLVSRKTASRLHQYAQTADIPIDRELRYDGQHCPSLLRIADQIAERVATADRKPANVMHGDFCLSNILFNSRSGRISVIDPRGYVEAGQPSIYGDTRYDLAKLSHSIHGRYDHILAGRYNLQHASNDFHLSFENEGHAEWLKAAFEELFIEGSQIDGTLIQALTISLFLSMLPLHADRPDRQRAFVGNALRLYTELEGGTR